MASVEVTIGDPLLQSGVDLTWFYTGALPEIPDSAASPVFLDVTTANKVVNYIEIRSDDRFSAIQFRIHGSASDTRVDLSNAAEEYEQAVTFEAGDVSLTIPGPAVQNYWDTRDVDEPYSVKFPTSVPSGSSLPTRSDVNSFIAAFRALPAATRNQTVLRISDGAEESTTVEISGSATVGTVSAESALSKVSRVVEIGGSATVGTVSAASSLTKEVPPLQLADFDDTGLEVVCLALIQAGRDDTGSYGVDRIIFNEYTDSGWPSVGSILAGDLEIDTDWFLSRIGTNSPDILRVNDHPNVRNLDEFFRSDIDPPGAGSDLTVWIQTQDGGAMSFTAAGAESAPFGGNWYNFQVPSAFYSFANSIESGTRFLFALTRPEAVPSTPVEIAASATVGTISATSSLSAEAVPPTAVEISGSATVGTVSVTSALSVESVPPGTRLIAGSATVGTISAASSLSIESVPPTAAEISGSVTVGTVTAASALSIEPVPPGTRLIAGTATVGTVSATVTLSRESVPPTAAEISGSATVGTFGATTTLERVSSEGLELQNLFPIKAVATLSSGSGTVSSGGSVTFAAAQPSNLNPLRARARLLGAAVQSPATHSLMGDPIRATATLIARRFQISEELVSHIQTPDLGRKIELMVVDATVFGNDAHIFRFTNSVQGPKSDGTFFPIEWGGEKYWPAPVQMEGFEINQQGNLPRPKLRVAMIHPTSAPDSVPMDTSTMENAKALLLSTLNSLDGIVGAKVTRIRTFERYLDKLSDGSPNPFADPTQKFPDDVYRIERKTLQESILLEFELASILEQTGKKLPGRVVLRDYCTHTYRRWNSDSGTFDYKRVTCPYAEEGSRNIMTGGSDVYFLANGEATTSPGEDNCGRRLSDCALRFGENPLPTRAFPGAGRTR